MTPRSVTGDLNYAIASRTTLAFAGSAVTYDSRRTAELRVGNALLSAASAQAGTASTRLGNVAYANPYDSVRIGRNAELTRFISDELFAFGAYERAFGGHGPLPSPGGAAASSDDVWRVAGANASASDAGRDARQVRDAARVDLGGRDNLAAVERVWELYAGGGDDRIAAAQVARLDAGGGDNALALADVVEAAAGDGNDTVVASGVGQLRTGGGADRIAVSAGWFVDAGDGADTVDATDTAYVAGGEGDDALRVLGARQADGGTGDDSIEVVAVEEVAGGEGADRIVAQGGRVIDGGDGDDTVSGAAFFLLSGGNGRDTIDATDVGRVEGGRGDDLLTLRRATAAYSRGDGFDVVRAGDGAGVEFEGIRRADVDITEIRTADGTLAALDVRLKDGSGGVRIEAAPGGTLADATLRFRDGARARLGDILRGPA
jgi:hypothetical protein